VLPDGTYILKPKIPIWLNFGWPWMENGGIPILWSFGIFYGHWVYFLPFGNVVVILYFSTFWYIVSRKIWQSCFWSPMIRLFWVGQRWPFFILMPGA
jgi:hypothetical protein